MSADYDTIDHDSARCLVVRGRLTSTNAEEFDEKLKGMVAESENQTIILNFEGVSTLTSAPLRTIVSVGNGLRKTGTPFIIAAASESSYESIRIGGFLRLGLWEMCSTMEEALQRTPQTKTARQPLPPAPQPSDSQPTATTRKASKPAGPPSLLPTSVPLPDSAEQTPEPAPQAAKSTDPGRKRTPSPPASSGEPSGTSDDDVTTRPVSTEASSQAKPSRGLFGSLWNALRYYTKPIPLIGKLVETATWWGRKFFGSPTTGR